MNYVICTGDSAPFETWLASQGGNIAQTETGPGRKRFRVVAVEEATLLQYAATNPAVTVEPQNPPQQQTVAGPTIRELARAKLKRAKRKER